MKHTRFDKHTLAALFLLLICTGLKAQSQSPVLKDSCHFSVPKLLSPNDADKLWIDYTCNIQTIKFEVFNRWGQLMYSTTVLSKQPDLNIYEKVKGKHGIERAKYAEGTYFWRASYEVLRNGQLITETAMGNIMIIPGP